MSAITALAALALGAGLVSAEHWSSTFESRFYSGEIILSETTPYQRIVISRDGDVVSMFINGALQFNTLDEYRYHESLVHPALSLSRHRENVLILGGGDGLAAREVLKYSDVKSVTLVDIDPFITRLFQENLLLAKLNDNALNDPRMEIINQDAWRYIQSTQHIFDVIIVDFPDPNDISLSKLYSRAFYADLTRRLAAGGFIVTQATSPLFNREAFWCIKHTLEAVPSPIALGEGLHSLPYHAYVPTFGEWGFVMASPHEIFWDRINIAVQTRFINAEILETLLQFPADMAETDTEINTLESHSLVYYYEQGWKRWYR